MTFTPRMICPGDGRLKDVVLSETNPIRIVKARAILPDRKARLLEDIDHLKIQLGRLGEAANKIYAEVADLKIKE